MFKNPFFFSLKKIRDERERKSRRREASIRKQNQERRDKISDFNPILITNNKAVPN